MKSALIAAAVLPMAILGLLGAGPASACRIRVVAEIPVHIEGGRPLADGRINGHLVRFLVDTGASTSALYSAAVPSLGLTAYEQESSRLYEVKRAQPIMMSLVESLRVGSFTARDFRFHLLESDAPGQGVVGRLGSDFLSRSDVEFDLAHGAIRFLAAEDCLGEEVMYWGGAFSTLPLIATNPDDHGLFVDAKVNGALAIAELASGVSRSVFSTSTARTFGADPDRGRVRPKTIALDQETIHNGDYPLADLSPRLREYNTTAYYSNGPLSQENLVLGTDFFASHRVLVSQGQRRLYFTYNGSGSR